MKQMSETDGSSIAGNDQGSNIATDSSVAEPAPTSWIIVAVRYVRRNPSLTGGSLMLLMLLLFVVIGGLLIDPDNARPMANRPRLAPSAEHVLGTDRQGKDVLTVMVIGTPQTLRIGLIAGGIGVVVGTVLAFFSVYYGGIVDILVSSVVDILRTVPGLLVLVIIAISVPGDMTVEMMALIVAALSWLNPARILRSQVLVLREKPYVEMARFSGMSGPEIIVKEMIPNLMPYLISTFVLAVAGAILASIGLEALGLGAFESNTLGMTIYWNIHYGSLLNGWWWWLFPPILMIVFLFVALFLVSIGLDEWANPRLRRKL
jgi:peptide/nickel transport system permease protein